MLEWKEFSEEYYMLGVGVSGAVFGVENLMEKRKSCSQTLTVYQYSRNHQRNKKC